MNIDSKLSFRLVYEIFLSGLASEMAENAQDGRYLCLLCLRRFTPPCFSACEDALVHTPSPRYTREASENELNA